MAYEIDLNALDTGQPHWLSKPKGEAAKKPVSEDVKQRIRDKVAAKLKARAGPKSN